MIRQQKLTMIVPVTAGAEDALKEMLLSIGTKIPDNDLLIFAKSISTHFARFVILDRETPHKLLFSACHAGSFDDYIKELVEHFGAALDGIFAHCKPYSPGMWKNSNQATAFVRQHGVGQNTFVVAFPRATPAQIIASRDMRIALDSLLDNSDVAAIITKLVADGPALPRPRTKISSPPGAIREFFDRFFVGRNTSKSSPVVETLADLRSIEDLIIQNQMTIVSPNRPGFARWKLRGVMFVIQLLNRLLGSTSSLPTIHFAQWSMIDNGDNLLFESNYDGTWENYIDEFIDYAFLGLDAIWGLGVGFPPGGSRNIEAFKSAIRKHQYPAQVFYSAYPDCTVQNIWEDSKLRDAFKTLQADQTVRRFISGTHVQQLTD